MTSAQWRDLYFRAGLHGEAVEKLRARARIGIHDVGLVEQFIQRLEETRADVASDDPEEPPRNGGAGTETTAAQG